MLEVPYLQKGYNFYEITHDINSYINEIFNSNFVLKTAGLFSLKIIYSDTNSSYKDNMVLKYFINGEYQKKNKEYRSLSRIVKVSVF